MELGSFFVSARTNKRHHHHRVDLPSTLHLWAPLLPRRLPFNASCLTHIHNTKTSFVPTLPLRTSFCLRYSNSPNLWNISSNHPGHLLSTAPRPSLSFNAMHASRPAFSESQIEGHPSTLALFKHFIHCACSWGHRAAPRHFNTLFSSALPSCHFRPCCSSHSARSFCTARAGNGCTRLGGGACVETPKRVSAPSPPPPPLVPPPVRRLVEGQGLNHGGKRMASL
jgi:hypothetical protein